MTWPAVQQRSGYLARVAVGILAPAPLGVFLLLAWSVLSGPKPIYLELWVMPLGYIAVSLVGYLLVGAQSVIYAILMEYVINPRLKDDMVALVLSALLGAVAAVSVLLFLSNPGAKADALFSGVLIVIGTVVGFGVGHILRRMYKQAANSAAQSDAFRSARNAPPHSAPGRER